MFSFFLYVFIYISGPIKNRQGSYIPGLVSSIDIEIYSSSICWQFNVGCRGNQRDQDHGVIFRNIRQVHFRGCKGHQRDHGVLFRNIRQVYGGTSRPTGCYRENANHMLRWVTPWCGMQTYRYRHCSFWFLAFGFQTTLTSSTIVAKC